jgi:hypothetical protein
MYPRCILKKRAQMESINTPIIPPPPKKNIKIPNPLHENMQKLIISTSKKYFFLFLFGNVKKKSYLCIAFEKSRPIIRFGV